MGDPVMRVGDLWFAGDGFEERFDYGCNVECYFPGCNEFFVSANGWCYEFVFCDIDDDGAAVYELWKVWPVG